MAVQAEMQGQLSSRVMPRPTDPGQCRGPLAEPFMMVIWLLIVLRLCQCMGAQAEMQGQLSSRGMPRPTDPGQCRGPLAEPFMMVIWSLIVLRLCQCMGAQMEMQSQRGSSQEGEVFILPTVRINHGQYRGKLAYSEVLKAICAGFTKNAEPDVCMRVSEDDCREGSVGDRECKARSGCALPIELEEGAVLMPTILSMLVVSGDMGICMVI